MELDKAIAADQEQQRFVQDLVAAAIPGAGGMTLPDAAAPAATPTESARARLAQARCEIEVIRGEREGAEAKILGSLGHASDIGIHNKSRWSRITGAVTGAVSGLVHKSLRAIGDIADRLSDLMTVVAVALAVVAAVGLMVGSGGALVAFAGPAALWLLQASAVTTAVSAGANISSKAVFDDADLSWGTLAKDGALAVVGVVGAGKLKTGGKLLKPTKAFQAISRRAAQVGPKLSALGSSPTGGQILFVHARRLGGEAKPLVLKGRALWTKVLGTPEDPTQWGYLKEAGKGAGGLWRKHAADPLKIIGPIQMGPPPEATAVPVTIRAA
ncbi:MAG: hypothetical protein ACRDZ3_13115 [Acidimicrobiia bacterium]